MKDLLVNPWVVGIGVTIVGGLILYFVFGVGKSTEIQKQPDNLTRKTYVKLTPREIVDYLQSLPPLQREDAATHYKGIIVSWAVSIVSGSKMSNGNIHLLTHYKGNFHPAIFCEVELVKYPELKIIKSDQEINIEGEIDVVDDSTIYLTNCRPNF